MQPLAVLILSDGRPGHYHLSEGVAAAIARRRPVSIERRLIARRTAMPGRVLAWLLASGIPPRLVLPAGYALAPADIPRADLVISAGGETIAANIAAATLLGARNIFCGTLRHAAPRHFSLIVSSYARHASLPRHLVALKPNGIDPDTLAAANHRRPGDAPVFGLLVGGDSGLFRYAPAEWDRLLSFLVATRERNGARWIVSTSRRSPAAVADALHRLAAAPASPILELIDFRRAGPGTLPRLFGSVDAILVTEDSSTMVSEAVCARLPVVGVTPVKHGFKEEEREYRAFLQSNNWYRSLPLTDLDPASFGTALRSVTPLAGNHLDRLAAELAERLPDLFR